MKNTQNTQEIDQCGRFCHIGIIWREVLLVIAILGSRESTYDIWIFRAFSIYVYYVVDKEKGRIMISVGFVDTVLFMQYCKK